MRPEVERLLHMGPITCGPTTPTVRSAELWRANRRRKRRMQMYDHRSALLSAIRVVVMTFCFAVDLSAQVARVFLSGTGNDLNDCSDATTPCRSLQGAVNQCPVSGVVIVMATGGYGTANITKSLTINTPSGVVAFVARTITVN